MRSSRYANLFTTLISTVLMRTAQTKRVLSIASMLIVAAIGPTTFQSPISPSAQAPTLAVHGPWMVYITTDKQANTNGLWVANQDGSAPTELIKDTTIASIAIAPKGGYLAYVSGETQSSGIETLKQTLNVLHLPGGHSTVITRLTTAATEPDGITRSYIAEAIGALQWSPEEASGFRTRTR